MANDRRPDRPHQEQWQRDLSDTLRRVGEQLATGLAHEAEIRATKFAQKAREKHMARETVRAERHRARAERRAARARQKWEAKLSKTHAYQGYTYVTLAAVFVLMAFIMPSVWWMVFVAIGFALKGAQIIGFHRDRQNELGGEEQDATDEMLEGDERAERIDDVCNKLKASLKDAPASVRDFLSKPEETVEALRKTSQDLLKREIALRALISTAEVERLNRERTGLLARIEMERDDIIRQRLSAALAALENQQQQHSEVQRSADRLEAERTRLMYTLEGLYAQVMRVRTADVTSPELGAGLRVSLDQLRDEVSALADAVEQVNRTSAGAGFEPPETFGEGAGSKSGNRVR